MNYNKYMRPEQPVHSHYYHPSLAHWQTHLLKPRLTKLTGPQAYRCLQVKGERESMHFEFHLPLHFSPRRGIGDEFWNWILIAHSSPKTTCIFLLYCKTIPAISNCSHP